jgi:N-acetylglucosaminyl-diphospho-decaprenol L-rhamnosyltransferase
VSLRHAGADRLVVVDNAVPSGNARHLIEQSDGIAGSSPEFIEPGVNLGYGSGVNRGAASCTKEFLCYCNADVVVDPSALVRLVEALETDPGIAIAGPQVLEPDGTRYPSARQFPSLIEGAVHALVGRVAPHNRFTEHYRMSNLSPPGTSEVGWVSGSFMLVRRKAFEELGGFDEAYFMYGEDVDLCWRAHRAGWKVAYVPDARITHRGAVSTSRHPYRMLASHHRSALRFANRSLSGPKRVALPFVGALLAVRLLGEIARMALRERPGDQGLSDSFPSDG